MAAILNLAILDSAILHKNTFSHSWLNLKMAAIFQPRSWIQTPCYLLQIHSKTLSLHSDSDFKLICTNLLKLIQSQ